MVVSLTRPSLKFFVNRENLIKDIMESSLIGRNTLIIGLRGYGKTSLSVKVLEEIEKRNYRTVFINCLKIVDPKSLLEEAQKDVKGLMNMRIQGIYELDDARTVIDAFFSFIKDVGVKVAVFDEITALLERFGSFKPFKKIGGPKIVAGYIREYLEDEDVAIIASDTSIDSIYELILNYSSPLLKSFDKVIFLDPLDIINAAKLLANVMMEKKKKIKNEVALNVAQRLFGVPQYIKFIGEALPNDPSLPEAEETIIEELTRGILNTYFELFMEKLSHEQKAILYAIARGADTYSAISKQFVSINTVRALKKLLKTGILVKIEKTKRRVKYRIYDRVLDTWLRLNEHPDLKKETAIRILISSLSFESYIREILSSITSPVEIIDENGEKLTIPKLENIERFTKGSVEIDVLARIEKNKALIGECYFGDKADVNKLEELEKGEKTIKELGYDPEIKIIFSYFGFTEELKEQAKLKNIYLLQAEHIRKIAKKAKHPAI